MFLPLFLLLAAGFSCCVLFFLPSFAVYWCFGVALRLLLGRCPLKNPPSPLLTFHDVCIVSPVVCAAFAAVFPVCAAASFAAFADPLSVFFLCCCCLCGFCCLFVFFS